MAALGVIKGLKENGIRIPEDVSIVSVDDESFSEYIVPSLTTISIDSYKLGIEAAKSMHKLLKGEKVKSKLFVKNPSPSFWDTS